jgi:hypothetical protein
MFLRYRGNVLADAKGKVSVSLKGLKVAGSSADIAFIDYTKELGTDPIKYYATALRNALSPNLDVIEIPEQTFVEYLKSAGAQRDRWTLRFWDIDSKSQTSKAITVGKEVPEVWPDIANALRARRRDTRWAGAEFTHAKLDVRIMTHRWPTAAIGSVGRGSSEYEKAKDAFVQFLRGL